MLHVVLHALFKAMLFMVIGVLLHGTSTQDSRSIHATYHGTGEIPLWWYPVPVVHQQTNTIVRHATQDPLVDGQLLAGYMESTS